MKPSGPRRSTVESAPPPQGLREDMLNRNIVRRYDTPRQYDTPGPYRAGEQPGPGNDSTPSEGD